MKVGGPRDCEHRCGGAPERGAARRHLVLLAIVVTAACGGCSANDPLNPSFPLRLVDARTELRRMSESPEPLERPVIVTGGIYDPGLVAAGIARRMRKIGGDGAPVMSVSFFAVGSFDDCRQRLLDAVQERYPSDDPGATVEVDVIGFSMGGLVARYSALPANDGRRLRIRRLFTIATPHRGAKFAGVPTFDARVVDMRPGAEFLSQLNDELEHAEYELYPYIRLGDTVVGVENGAPPGRVPWWVANDPFTFAHLGAGDDERILADIAARLRGEQPYTTSPPAIPPESESQDRGPEAVAGSDGPAAGLAGDRNRESGP